MWEIKILLDSAVPEQHPESSSYNGLGALGQDRTADGQQQPTQEQRTWVPGHYAERI